jgi:flagellar biosynthesis/type III secretory pathway protein FliH
MPSTSSADRPWIVRGDTPAALLVPRSAPLPTQDDVEAAYERGRAEGRRAAEAERAQAVLALQEAAHGARRELAHHFEQTRVSTIALSVDLATELARWLVNHAIALEPSVLRTRIDQALESIADERGARFFVAHSMVELVRGWLGAEAVVDADPTLEPGELRIDAGHASLDATYEVALGRARAALITSFEHGQPDAPIVIRDVREHV